MKKLFFLAFIFLFCENLYAQSDKHLAQWKAADKKFRETAEIQADTYREVMTEWEFENRKDTILVDSYLKLGLYYSYEEKEARSALKYLKDALKIAHQISSQKPPFLQIYKEIADLFYFELQQTDSALYYYKKAEKYINQTIDYQAIAYLYNSLAYLNQDKGNWSLALNNYEKQLFFLKKIKNNKFEIENFAIVYNNLGELYKDLGEYNQALEMYFEVLNSPYFSQKKYLENDLILQPYQVYNNMGYAYLQLSQTSQALEYFQKSFAQSRNALKDSAFQIIIVNNLGKAQEQQGNFEQAKTYFEQAISKNTKYPYHQIESYLGLSRLAEKKQNISLALKHTQKALMALCPAFRSEDLLETPNNLQTFSNLELFKVLRRKADLLALPNADSKNNISQRAALKTYETALKLAERIRKRYFHDETKLFFQKEVSPTFEKALALALSLNEKEKAFQFAEGSKAVVLAEALQKISLDHLLDSALLVQEKENRHRIIQLEQKLLETKKEAEKKTINEQLNDLWIRQAQIQDQHEQNPQFSQFKYAENSLSIKTVQNEILYDDSTALIEYLVGKDKLYIFVITKNNFQVFESPIMPNLRNLIADLSNRLTKYQLDDRIRQDANLLYQQLMSPIRHLLPKRLIIIPDAELHYLGFDMLVSDLKKTRYLLYDHVVSRAYSAQLLHQAIKNRKPANKINSILAIAPFAYQPESATIAVKRSDLLPLPKSIEEMQYLKNFGAKVFEKTAAVKDSILSFFKNYDIIHFATHAVANDSLPAQSFIACYPDSTQNWRIYTSDLYELNLERAKLVILSACQTGRGQLKQGEGVMSLARGFTYAGCPNIAFTLWNANDEASFQIFTSFHEYLQKGMPKDEALHQAKLDYFQKGMRNREPFYWACFEFQGDSAPVYQPTGLQFVFWIVGIWAFLLLVFLVYRYKTRRRV